MFRNPTHTKAWKSTNNQGVSFLGRIKALYNRSFTTTAAKLQMPDAAKAAKFPPTVNGIHLDSDSSKFEQPLGDWDKTISLHEWREYNSVDDWRIYLFPESIPLLVPFTFCTYMLFEALGNATFNDKRETDCATHWGWLGNLRSAYNWEEDDTIGKVGLYDETQINYLFNWNRLAPLSGAWIHSDYHIWGDEARIKWAKQQADANPEQFVGLDDELAQVTALEKKLLAAEHDIESHLDGTITSETQATLTSL